MISFSFQSSTKIPEIKYFDQDFIDFDGVIQTFESDIGDSQSNFEQKFHFSEFRRIYFRRGLNDF